MLEQRKAGIARELDACIPVPRLPQQVVQNRLDEWRRLLRASTTQARAVLQRVIQGRITFTPTGTESIGLDASGLVTVEHRDPTGYAFEAPTRFDKLFAGITFKVPASLVGDTSGWGHTDTTLPLDADYGALLEKAYAGVTANVWRPQRDSNPCFGLERATSWASGRWGRNRALRSSQRNTR